MRKLITILSLLFYTTVSFSQNITLELGKVGVVENMTFAAAPLETKGYIAFGYGFQLSNQWVINGCKKSGNHVAQGDFAVVVSRDGGATSSIHYVRYAGSIVQTAQGSFFYDDVAGYLYALTIDENLSGNGTHFYKVETYRIAESTFTSNLDADWEKTTTVDFTSYGGGVYIGDLWGDCLKMPSGKVLVPIHLTDGAGRNIAQFIQSTNSGSTWSIGGVILDITSTGTFPNGAFSEVNPCISEVGATDATTKIVVLIRNESYGLWAHVKSSDGGATWVHDITHNFGYDYYDSGLPPLSYGHPSGIPISSKLYNGYVYSVIGYRGNSGGNDKDAVAVLRLSPSEFFDNPYPTTSAVVTVLKYGTQIYNNVLNTIQVDFGYPMLFITTNGLWCHYYDNYDPSSSWLDGVTKTRLSQIKVAN